jgi:Xaa-Pro aminopeptidase
MAFHARRWFRTTAARRGPEISRYLRNLRNQPACGVKSKRLPAREPFPWFIDLSGSDCARCLIQPCAVGVVEAGRNGELFLIDSGAQYDDGTTDVTRTVAIGEPTAEMRDRFTRVLKGHIQLALARFPEGTTGAQLDAFARKPLWDAGLDYGHGTGHGVGSYLSVHEGPQSISSRGTAQALKPGMICSNEPGYYKAGEYGIRIENLVIVRPPEDVPGGEKKMLSFETITMAPIDLNLVETSMLTPAERDWLNAYHAEVRAAVAPGLNDTDRAWLDQATRAI